MTIIAYRDGVLASDSRITVGTLIIPGGLDKIKRLKNGVLVGACGTAVAIEAFFKWAKGKRTNPPPTLCKKADMLFIAKDGFMEQYEGRHKYVYQDQKAFVAIGSGASSALGAMFHGATAIEAVEAAIALDSACGGEIRVLRLGEYD